MRWLAHGFLGFVVELWVLVGLGRLLGGEALLGWILGTALVGVLLVKYEGLRVVSSFRSALTELRPPDEGVTAELLLLVAAVLLILPGVLGDLLGVALLLPPARNACARWIQARVARHLNAGVGSVGKGQRAGHPSQRAPGWRVARRVHTPRGRGGVIDVEGELIEER